MGIAELTDDETTANMLQATIDKYDPSLPAIPEEFKAKLSKGVVGVKITIASLQGKEKLGQHSSSADQLGVTSALAKATDFDAKQLYQYMQDNNMGTGC